MAPGPGEQAAIRRGRDGGTLGLWLGLGLGLGLGLVLRDGGTSGLVWSDGGDRSPCMDGYDTDQRPDHIISDQNIYQNIYSLIDDIDHTTR